MVPGIIQAMRGTSYAAPKTILGFLAGIVAIAGATVVGLAFALAGTPSLRFLIIGFVSLVASIVVAAFGVVVYFAARDPSKLLLGQVSAQDYIAIQQMGDDTYGEYVQLPGASSVRSSDESRPPSLEPPGSEDEI